MAKDIPQRSLMNVALAIAESDGLPLNQRHLREAGLYLDAAICDEDDCFLPAGHDSDCLPVLLQAGKDRQELQDCLEAAIGMLNPESPLVQVCAETLASTQH